jgi:hypothetical protein
MPNARVTEDISDRDRIAFAAKKLRERNILLGIIKEEIVPKFKKHEPRKR